MRPQDTPAYTPGTVVFAKLKGYPWWPARIENDQDVPTKVLKHKAKTKGPLQTVFFFGSRDYGFFGPDAIRPFHHASVAHDLKAKKFKGRELEQAIRQALDPSLLSQVMDGESTKDNDNDEDQNGHGSKKSKAVKRKVNEKKAVPNGRRKAKHVQEKEQPAVSVLRNKRRLRNSGDVADDKTSKESVRDTKKRRRSASANKEDENGYEGANSSPVPHNHEDESQASDDTATEKGKIKTFDVGMSKDIPGFKKMYQIRHKLQKLVYDKKPGEIPTEDYSKIALIIQEIEKSTMTYNLLRETKIGKVVKAACSYAYEKDTEYNIKKRCQDLMKTWRAQFTNGQVSALESRAIITNVTSNSKTSKVDRETEPITTETVEERPPYGEQMAEPLLVGGMVAKDDTHTLSAVATHEKQTMLIDPPQDTMMQEA